VLKKQSQVAASQVGRIGQQIQHALLFLAWRPAHRIELLVIHRLTQTLQGVLLSHTQPQRQHPRLQRIALIVASSH
jgi:hypothetical protein